MSLEEHHKFILQTMQRHDDMARKFIAELEAENARLQAEVERLRKAGDELLHEWSSGDETDARNFKKGLALWNAAKEGKQS